MNFLDLFSGIGGFALGFERAGFKFEKHYFSEIDKYATSIYQGHFPDAVRLGDVRRVGDELGEIDVVAGGFPCQSFSIAGKRRGFEDTRGTLFFELARILRDKKPRLFIFENVKGLISHDGGSTFKTIISTITELGYDCQWQVLNSKDFGVPQNRERVFIVGHIRGTARPEVFPIVRSTSQNIRKLIGGSQGNRVYSVGDISCTISSQGGGQGAKTGLYDVGFVNSTNGVAAHDGVKIRRLTPVECERLQSFPDNWTKHGVDGELISDTQRYKCLGNAVTVNVITALAKEIKKAMEGI